MPSMRRLRAASELPSDFVSASVAVIRLASAVSGRCAADAACCDASAASIFSSRAESSLVAAGCDGSLTRGGTVSPRGGSTPDAHSAATITSIVSAPAAAAMPYAAAAPRFSEPALSAKSQRARRPAALSSSVRSSAAPVAPASAVEAGLSDSTSVAFRSMVGGRRRDVSSGSLVMRSPAGPTVRSAGGLAPRHSTWPAWRQQTGLPPVQSGEMRASKAAASGRSAARTSTAPAARSGSAIRGDRQ